MRNERNLRILFYKKYIVGSLLDAAKKKQFSVEVCFYKHVYIKGITDQRRGVLVFLVLRDGFYFK